ncbi:sugar transferase [Microvirga rosea]|uniref:sugar transferase n=1 Tax=Microvirga rosea TaxID=2715425 RepID=UPI001D0A3C13|nr:sugar transferase [Microvirga rosea]MCB8818930.1 sugar transferase [Microvirga rosea]
MAARDFLTEPVDIRSTRSALILDKLPRKWDVARVNSNVSPYLTSSTKRILDLVLAFIMLIALLPLVITAAIAIKCSSPGSIIFRQRRHGVRQTPFMILKLRSMTVESCMDASVRQVTQQDPRVTPIGRFLRKTSIDELPQLINVLKGEMSLVGPRPHALVHDEKYLAVLPTYASRFAALPGITGLAQVNGARGETPTLAHMERRLQLDLEYIRKASLLLDVKILVLTAITVLKNQAHVY